MSLSILKSSIINPQMIGAALIVVVMAGAAIPAQQPPARAAEPAPARSARAMAPVDLTGYWVSVASEDWQWRMFTPPKGDYASVPLNPEGRRVADMWTPEQDGSCQAYGVGAVMRNPGRVHITWENDTTLKIDADAGRQTRLLHFSPSQPAGPPTLQGYSTAEWQTPPPGRGTGAGANAINAQQQAQRPRWASLKVVTTSFLPAWLRKNGVPYSDKAVITEYFDQFSEPEAEWFTVTTIVDDPTYLNQPFIISSNFQKERDGAKWHPVACKM